MFIRRAQTRSLASGQIYATFRLVQTVRTGSAVRQSTLLNLGSHFDLPQPQWPALVKRIEDLLHGQAAVADPMLSDEGQVLAQRYGAQLLALRASAGDGARTPALSPGGGEFERFQEVDLDSLELVRPRSVGVEHAGLSAMRQCGFEAKLAELGLNPAQIAAAVGNIVARMACPGSELASHGWLQQHSGLGELLGFDFEAMDLSRLYRASDTLYRHRVALQEHLFAQAQTLFSLGQTITLYDLTNTYFEGAAAGVRKAKRGHSKECRSDCPLVTLALVLDGSGFVRRSQVFAGNTSEPATLADMLSGLQAQPGATVVMDAGIATEANLAWLRQQGYHYVVVSRLRQRQFDPTQASEVQTAGDVTVKLYRVMDPHGNLLLYCHSPAREPRAIDTAKASGFEAALGKLQAGLSKPRGSHDLATVMQRLGRAKQRYARAAQHYDVQVQQDASATRVDSITWTKTITPGSAAMHPGVYCLRSTLVSLDDATLWHTYIMLTNLESVFRSLKTDLGLRPVYHQIDRRVEGHLFISVLAYHFVHMLRTQLKDHAIHDGWHTLRQTLSSQRRITVTLARRDGRMVHVRKASRPEPQHHKLNTILGLSPNPGGTQRTVV